MTTTFRGKSRLDMLNRIDPRAGHLPRTWWSVRNAAGTGGDPADLWIYDEIGYWGTTADLFRQDLAAITASEIVMHVNSPGGDLFDGVAIYNAIRSHPAHVTARVDSLAASIASVIVQAADRRVMMPHSQMMIHDAWGVAVGNAATMIEAAAMLQRQSGIIADIYHERTRGGKAKLDKIVAAMAAETWFEDDAAVEFGLADAVERPAWKTEPDAADPPPEEDEGDDGDDQGDGDAPAEDDLDAMLRAELARIEGDAMEELFS